MISNPLFIIRWSLDDKIFSAAIFFLVPYIEILMIYISEFEASFPIIDCFILDNSLIQKSWLSSVEVFAVIIVKNEWCIKFLLFHSFSTTRFVPLFWCDVVDAVSLLSKHVSSDSPAGLGSCVCVPTCLAQEKTAVLSSSSYWRHRCH